MKDEAGASSTRITDFIMAARAVDPGLVIFNRDDVMLLPTIIQGAQGIMVGGPHIFDHEVRAIFGAFAAGSNQKELESFVSIYRFCKPTGQNGRLLPNSILRPAIGMVFRH